MLHSPSFLPLSENCVYDHLLRFCSQMLRPRPLGTITPQLASRCLTHVNELQLAAPELEEEELWYCDFNWKLKIRGRIRTPLANFHSSSVEPQPGCVPHLSRAHIYVNAPVRRTSKARKANGSHSGSGSGLNASELFRDKSTRKVSWGKFMFPLCLSLRLRYSLGFN